MTDGPINTHTHTHMTDGPTNPYPYPYPYDGWSYQSRATGQGYAGNCCCKNIKNGLFTGNQVGSIMGGRTCLRSGKNAY